jgi:hypothetical protein
MASYQPTPLAQAWSSVVTSAVAPRIALGNFLDDWRRFSAPNVRWEMVCAAIAESDNSELHRWDCFAAATVEYLTVRGGVPTPDWVFWDRWTLDTPWFLFSNWKLRAWQLVATPPPWKRRRIFGGDETALIGRV